MKNKLLLLLPIISLCTSCSFEPLFFTGKVATEEELISFFSKVSDKFALIPDGWYKYEQISHIDDYETARIHLIFYVESIEQDNGHVIYNFIKLKGEDVGKNNLIHAYYLSDENMWICKQVNTRNNNIEIRGSKTSRFRVGGMFFHSLYDLRRVEENSNYYIKDTSFHFEKITDDYTGHIGIKYSDDYKSIILGKSYLNRKILDSWHIEESTIQSCDPEEIEVTDDYELDVDYGILDYLIT